MKNGIDIHHYRNTRIITTVFLATLISFGICIVIIALCVNPYLEDNKRELSVLNFYEQNRVNESNNIYFIGSSQIVEGIDAYIIEDYLEGQNYTFQVYNLGIQADCPLLRVTELDHLIASEPRSVVIGMNYNGLYNSTEINDERLTLVSERVTLDNFTKNLYNAEKLQSLNQFSSTRAEYTYKRKFIKTSILYLLFSNELIIEDLIGESIIRHFNAQGGNFKNPYVYTRSKTHDELLESLESEGLLLRWCTVYQAENSQKKALNHIIDRLKENNINVIVINMPLNPLLSEKVPNSARDNYFSYLNGTGVTYYDFETNYPSDHFIDLTHVNAIGRNKLSNDVAKIICEEVRAGAL